MQKFMSKKERLNELWNERPKKMEDPAEVEIV
jgi:hypothetical protein